MINSLKIINRDHIRNVELLNLSKINIFCGKNNAGKTTILNTLSGGSEKFMLGEEYSFDEVWSFFVKVNTKAREELQDEDYWSDNLLEEYYSSLYLILEEYNKPFYFIDDLLILTQQVFIENKEEGLYETIYKVIQEIIGQYDIFPYLEPDNIISIPANRFIEPRVNYSTQQNEIKPTGEGIVSKVFFMKNQLAGTPELIAYLR
ncbi:hypothetical protein J4G37_39220, partial [Microvirga sp. 3-52]|nr:hypothetical protein [Microvirga sp. 3-52]